MKIAYIIGLSFLAFACAQINPLTGGERDTTAPVLDSSKTAPLNGAINFSGDELVLTFQEYIILKNPSENILITPQLKEKPTITAKNKTFKLKFNEALSPQTTYAISFNRAIADYTESNDSVFQYVFSTGNFIDSLQIQGRLTDAYTNKPVEDAIIGLYLPVDTLTYDEIPIHQKPTYLSLTNAKGEYEINYIKNGTYHLFAFIDKDRNLKYNPNSEQIAFYGVKPIEIDTNLKALDLKLYTPKNETIQLSNSTLDYPGKMTLVFTNPPNDVNLKSADSPLLQRHTGRSDSLEFWLRSPYTKSTQFILAFNQNTDTIKPIMKGIPDAPEPLNYTTNFDVNKLLPFDTLTLEFNEPIGSFNKDLIHVFDKDSTPLSFEVTIHNLTGLQIFSDNQADAYVSIDSGAIESQLTHRLNAPIQLNYTYHPPTYLGQLTVTVINETFWSKGILELLDQSGVLVQSYPIDSSITTLPIKQLKPGSYQLRYIEDANADSKWTSGNLKTGTQPEAVFYYESNIKVRSNWELEIDWVFQ